MHKLRSRGFTLIELLVVIAIIGILSAVVLASLNTARSKGSDAAVQSDLSTVQTEAEIWYGSNNNNYGTVSWGTGTSCTGAFGDPTMKSALAGADSSNSTKSVGCAAAGTTYVVAAELVSTTSYWCIDSTGKSEGVSATFPGSAIAACP